LAELVREVGRRRDAIREFGLAGYASLVDEHRVKLGQVYDLVRRHCAEHGLELPRGIPKR
jgi:hypothetical protein